MEAVHSSLLGAQTQVGPSVFLFLRSPQAGVGIVVTSWVATSRVDFTMRASSAETWVKCSHVLTLAVGSSAWTGIVAPAVILTNSVNDGTKR